MSEHEEFDRLSSIHNFRVALLILQNVLSCRNIISADAIKYFLRRTKLFDGKRRGGIFPLKKFSNLLYLLLLLLFIDCISLSSKMILIEKSNVGFLSPKK